jgi:hypothetical protein
MSAWCSSGYYFGINFLELETGALMVKQALMSNVFDMSEVGGGMVIGRVGHLSVHEQKKLRVEFVPVHQISGGYQISVGFNN